LAIHDVIRRAFAPAESDLQAFEDWTGVAYEATGPLDWILGGYGTVTSALYLKSAFAKPLETTSGWEGKLGAWGATIGGGAAMAVALVAAPEVTVPTTFLYGLPALAGGVGGENLLHAYLPGMLNDYQEEYSVPQPYGGYVPVGP